MAHCANLVHDPWRPCAVQSRKSDHTGLWIVRALRRVSSMKTEAKAISVVPEVAMSSPAEEQKPLGPKASRMGKVLGWLDFPSFRYRPTTQGLFP